VPKRIDSRLSTSMQLMGTNWQPGEQRAESLFCRPEAKESKLKLSLEMRNRGDVIIVHCQGRIVYRDEAATLSRVVGEMLHYAKKLVLDLTGVSSMDSAGIGELALLQACAQGNKVDLKCAGPNSLVRTLLEITHLNRVLDIQPSIEAAIESFQQEEVCADC
jgi:anti-anti-sigma factor